MPTLTVPGDRELLSIGIQQLQLTSDPPRCGAAQKAYPISFSHQSHLPRRHVAGTPERRHNLLQRRHCPLRHDRITRNPQRYHATRLVTSPAEVTTAVYGKEEKSHLIARNRRN